MSVFLAQSMMETVIFFCRDLFIVVMIYCSFCNKNINCMCGTAHFMQMTVSVILILSGTLCKETFNKRTLFSL